MAGIIPRVGAPGGLFVSRGDDGGPAPALHGNQDEDEGGEDQSVDAEGEQGAAFEVVDQEPDGEPAADEGGDDREGEGTGFARRQAVAQEVQGLVGAGRAGDGDAEHERQAGGGGAVQARQQSGRDRDAGARGPRDQRQRLRASHGQALAPSDASQRVAGTGAGDC